MPLLLGFALSSIIAGIAFWRGSLSASGAMGAVLIGGVTFGLGGWTCGLLLVLFFVTSSALSRFREADKRKAGGGVRKGQPARPRPGPGERRRARRPCPRQWSRDLGGMAGHVHRSAGSCDRRHLGDGARHAQPHPAPTDHNGRSRRVGTSGGISVLGTLAALAGGATIGLAAGLLPSGLAWWIALPLGLVSGLAGSLVDSLLGASLQRQGYCPSCQAATEARIHHCGAATEAHAAATRGLAMTR